MGGGLMSCARPECCELPLGSSKYCSVECQDATHEFGIPSAYVRGPDGAAARGQALSWPLPAPDTPPPVGAGSSASDAQEAWRAFQSTHFGSSSGLGGCTSGGTSGSSVVIDLPRPSALSAGTPGPSETNLTDAFNALNEWQEATEWLKLRERQLDEARAEIAEANRSQAKLLRVVQGVEADAQAAKREATAAHRLRKEAQINAHTAISAAEQRAYNTVAEAEMRVAKAERRCEELLQQKEAAEARARQGGTGVRFEDMVTESLFKLKAQEACAFARNSLVNGSSDSGLVLVPALAQKLYRTQSTHAACCCGGWASTTRHDGNLETIVRNATTAMRMKFGNAGELACVAFAYLFQRGIKCQFWQWQWSANADSHYFVIVGPDDVGTNPLNWVCDPWGGGCYPVQELPDRLGILFGSGLNLENAFCRAVNMNTTAAICLAEVDRCIAIQSAQLDSGNIIELPNLANMPPKQQLAVLSQLPF